MCSLASLILTLALTINLSFAATLTIDFKGVTSPSTTHIARYDVDDENLENDPSVGTEFTTQMYEAISSIDETYVVTRVTCAYFYSQQIFRFKVGSFPIKEFTVTWRGNIAFMWVGVYHKESIVIWNNRTQSWEWVGNVSKVGDFETYPGPPQGASVQGRMAFMAPDETITKAFTENISDYINNGYITIMVWARNCHDATICTDYVKLEWKPSKYYLNVISPYGVPSGQGWYDAEATAYARLDAGIIDHGNGTRRVFTHWSGDATGTDYSKSDPIYMDDNKTAIANWKTQYYLTVNSPYGSPTVVSGWFDAGTLVSITVTSPWPGTPGTRYICLGWTGTGSVPPSGTTTTVTFTINKPSSITWNWKTQYMLTIDTNPKDLTPKPTRSPQGEAENRGWWYDADTQVTVTAQTVNGYTFDHWDIDGEPQPKKQNPVVINMNKPHTATAHYTLTTYTLTITATTGGTTNPPPGNYIHNAGSQVQVTAIPNINYIFDHWELDTVNVGSANPFTVLMDKNHTLKAVFTYSPLPPLTVSITPPSASIYVGQSVTFTSTVTGGKPPYSYQWILNNNPVPGATSSSWIFTPTTSGIYYVQLKVTDANNNVAQSEPSKVTVTTIPVGGYSTLLNQKIQATSIAFYITITALFAAVICIIRRKRI